MGGPGVFWGRPVGQARRPERKRSEERRVGKSVDHCVTGVQTCALPISLRNKIFLLSQLSEIRSRQRGTLCSPQKPFTDTKDKSTSGAPAAGQLSNGWSWCFLGATSGASSST